MKAILIVCVWCAVAGAEPWPMQVPAGWVEQKAAAEGQLAKLRSVPGTVRGEGTIYLSPEGDAQLTVLRWDIKLDHATREAVEQLDRGMTAGASEVATHHLSDGRHFVAQQLRGSTVDEVNQLRVHQERIYGVDRGGVIHLVSAICTAAPAALGPCEVAQATLTLQLADAATFDETSEDLAYKFGYAVGGVLSVMLVIWVIRRFVL